MTATPPRLTAPSLGTFIVELSSIAPAGERPIAPDSHLIDDLDFDAIAFNRLGLLVYERYGIGGLSTAALRSEHLTVEGFFRNCILEVLGEGDSR